jgi:hypothetical protein
MATSLASAIFEQLRGNPVLVNAFGDTYNAQAATGISKFSADYATQVPLPWLIETEPNETTQYMSRVSSNQVHYITTGTVNLAVYADDRDQAKFLGEYVADVLMDALLAWPGIKPMNLRDGRAGFVPLEKAIGPHGPGSIFQRIVVFDYEFSGTRTSSVLSGVIP